MNAARKPTPDAVALITLVSCCVIRGHSQAAAKVSLTEGPPPLQCGVRSLGAALLLAWARWRGLQVFGRDCTGGPGLVAGVLFAAEFACLFLGLQHTSASRMAVFLYLVFLYLAPFVVALGLLLIWRQVRLAPALWASLVMACTLLTPVFGLLAGVGLLGAPLKLRIAVALLAVCAGIWLVNRATAPARLAA
jgi:drug/metabolite transporter (DMT)-like permease